MTLGRQVAFAIDLPCPADEGEVLGDGGRLGRGASPVTDIAAVRSRRRVQQRGTVVVVVIAFAGKVLINDRDIGVAVFEGFQYSAGDRSDVNRPEKLRRFLIAAVFIQASHGVEGSFQRGQFRFVCYRPVESDHADTASGREGRKQGFRIDPVSDVFKPAGGQVLHAGQHKIRDPGMSDDGQVGQRPRQVQRLDDAALGKFDTRNGSAVKINVLDIGAAGDVDGL